MTSENPPRSLLGVIGPSS